MNEHDGSTSGRGEVIQCLLHALTDTQETLRAYDIKAQSMGVLLTVAIGIINFNIAESSLPAFRCLAAVASCLGLCAIFALGLVLHPRDKSWMHIPLGDYVPARTYFVTNPNLRTLPVPTLADLTSSTDWLKELTYELMKLSAIREAKKIWFIRSLILSAATLLAIVSLVVGSASIGKAPQVGETRQVPGLPAKSEPPTPASAPKPDVLTPPAQNEPTSPATIHPNERKPQPSAARGKTGNAKSAQDKD